MLPPPPLLLLLSTYTAYATNTQPQCFSISNSQLCPRFKDVLLTFPLEDPLPLSTSTTFTPSDDALRSYLASWFHGVTESTNFDKKLQQLVDISTGTYYSEFLGCTTPNVTAPAHARYETTIICRQLVQYFFCPDNSFDPNTSVPICRRTCDSWAQSIISGLPPNAYTQTGFYIPRTVEIDRTASFSQNEVTEQDFLRNQNNICLSPPDLKQWNSLASRSYCSDRPYLNGTAGQCVDGDENEIGEDFLCGYRNNKASCALCDIMMGNLTLEPSKYSLFPHTREPCCANYGDICNPQSSNQNGHEYGKGGPFNEPIPSTTFSSAVVYGAVVLSAVLFIFSFGAFCVWRCRSNRRRRNSKLASFYERRLVAGRPANLRKPKKTWWRLKVETNDTIEFEEQTNIRHGSQTGSEISHALRDGKLEGKSTDSEKETGTFKVLGIQQMKLIPKKQNRDSIQCEGDINADGDGIRRPSINVISSDIEDNEVILVEPDICNNLPLAPSVLSDHTKTADEIETFGGFVSPTYANLYKQQHALTTSNKKPAMALRGSILTVSTSPRTLQKPFVGHTPSSQSSISTSPSPTETTSSISPQTYSPSEALLSRKSTSHSYSRNAYLAKYSNSPLETIIQKPTNTATVLSKPFAAHPVDHYVTSPNFVFPMQSEQTRRLSAASSITDLPLPHGSLLSATHTSSSAAIPIASPVPLTSVASTVGPSRMPYTAIYHYCPALSDEITLNIGDQLVVNQIYDDAWGYGTNVTTGFSGVFPLACCEVRNVPSKERCLPLQKESTAVISSEQKESINSALSLLPGVQSFSDDTKEKCIPAPSAVLANPGYDHLTASRTSSLTRIRKNHGPNSK